MAAQNQGSKAGTSATIAWLPGKRVVRIPAVRATGRQVFSWKGVAGRMEELEQARQIGDELLKRGLPVAAKEHWMHWYQAAEGDTLERLRACNALGLLARRQHEYATARNFYEEAFRLTEEPQVKTEDRVKTLTNLASLAYLTGDTSRAGRLALEARQASVAIHDAALLGWVQLTLSAVHIASEQWQDAGLAAFQAQRRFAETGRSDLVAHALRNLGIVDVETGRLQSAEERLLLARQWHLQHKDISGTAHDLTELGRLYFRRGDYALALGAGSQALDVLLADASLLDRAEVARLSLLFGAINMANGRKAPALNYLNRAAAYFAQLGFTREWDEANQLTRQVLDLTGPTRLPAEFTVEERRLNYLTAVLDLTDQIECVDTALRGHSERVASLCLVIGRYLRLPPARIYALGHAARLHDLGKVAGEDHHPETGARMAQAFPLPEESILAIRHHHERMDGSGGPDGLIGDDIPVLARIIALADAYDHLTSASSESLPHSEALRALQGQAGKTVDHRLADAMITLHQVGREVHV